MSPKLKSKVGPMSIVSLAREVRGGNGETGPVAVAGARELVPLLARELRAGGDESAIVEQNVDGAAALVWIGAADESVLRAAHRSKVPIVAVTDAGTLPHVLPEDIVRVPPGQGFPVERIAAAVARKLEDDPLAIALAARLPVLREAVCERLIATVSRRNALIGVAVWVPAVDMPILTLNQVRLVMRIARAHGVEIDRVRAVELLGVVGAGFGFRAIARELLDLVPVGGWAVKGAIAYTGTRVVGEAAARYFAALR
jgi:uncharacterized protein (DUF697 family)